MEFDLAQPINDRFLFVLSLAWIDTHSDSERTHMRGIHKLMALRALTNHSSNAYNDITFLIKLASNR